MAALHCRKEPWSHMIGWVGSRAGLHMIARENFCPCWKLNPSHPAHGTLQYWPSLGVHLPYFLEYPMHFFFKCRPRTGVGGLFMHRHWWHCCLSLYEDMPTVLLYLSDSKCVTFAYKLSVPKWSQPSHGRSKLPDGILCRCVVPVVSKKEYKGNAFACSRTVRSYA
jgi:hypothetical protein